MDVTERRRTKAEERANTELYELLHETEKVRSRLELKFVELKFNNIPPEWGLVEQLVPVRRPKVRVNASFDADMVKFYRSMGHGYQARMNYVLRTYMCSVLSRYISTRKGEDWLGDQI